MIPYLGCIMIGVRAFIKGILPAPAYHALKRLAERARADRFHPAYNPRQFLRTVLRSSEAAEQSMLGVVDEHWRAGRTSDAIRALVNHFDTRRAPGLLFDASLFRREHSAFTHETARWITAACGQVREMTCEGLSVYGERAPALRPGFPWGGQWYAGQEDVLFKARPHRFAFAPRLALAVLGGTYSAEDFAALLRDWMSFASRHPALPFISTFLVIQRLVASTCAWSFLSAASDAEETALASTRSALLQIVSQDAAYLIPRIGQSYPNGHLLTDRFAGWFMAFVYPEFCHRLIEAGQAESLWLAELERQTYDDGGSFEHSVHYHGLATEMALVYLLLKRNNARELRPRHAERIRNMLRLQADLSGPDGHAPNIGDGTEDPMLPLDGGTGTTPAAMREIYRRLFAPSIPALAHQHPGGERAFWLLSDASPQSRQPSPRRTLSVSSDSGMFVFFDHEEATRCVLRTGPAPNTPSMAGHMHADLLSINLIYKNVPVVVDAGTYSYRWHAPTGGLDPPNWREYFAGPLAHNGIVIDGHDPLGPVVGDFRRGSSAACVQHTNMFDGEGLSLVEARIISPPDHANLGRGVVHVRGEYFLAYGFSGGDVTSKAMVFPLQFHHRVRVLGEDDHVLRMAGEDDVTVAIVYSDELVLAERHEASTNPVRGWCSPRYGELFPATQLLFRAAADREVSAFALCLNADAPVVRIAGCRIGDSTHVFEAIGPEFHDYLFVNSGPPEALTSRFGVAFQGRLLWVRVTGTERTEVRASDIISCKAPSLGIALEFETSQREIRDIGHAR